MTPEKRAQVNNHLNLIRAEIENLNSIVDFYSGNDNPAGEAIVDTSALGNMRPAFKIVALLAELEPILSYQSGPCAMPLLFVDEECDFIALTEYDKEYFQSRVEIRAKDTEYRTGDKIKVQIYSDEAENQPA
jgi:hypothetical protein